MKLLILSALIASSSLVMAHHGSSSGTAASSSQYQTVYVKTRGGRLHVRSHARFGDNIISKLPVGSEIKIMNINEVGRSGFVRVVVKESDGVERMRYVDGRYLSKIKNNTNVGSAMTTSSVSSNSNVNFGGAMDSSYRSVVKRIKDIAASNSGCLQSATSNRGRIQNAKGAFYGIATTFARSVCRPTSDPIKKAMLNGRSGRSRSGYPFDYFRHLGLWPKNDRDKMIDLYQVLLPHTFQETSGHFWEGRDISNSTSVKSTTAEAGLCQTSENIHYLYKNSSGKRAMKQVVAQYQNKIGNEKACMTSVFSTQMNVKSGRSIVGSGRGATFQKTMRRCPASAVEHCAIAIRHVLPHYGPLRKKRSRPLRKCRKTFEAVYDLVQANRSNVCNALGIPQNTSGGSSSGTVAL